MRRNQFLLFLLSALLFLGSCSKDEETQSKNGPSLKQNQGKPFTGSMNYQFNPFMDLPCDCGSFYPAGTFSGSGNISHMGLATSNIKPCLAPIIVGGNEIGSHVGVECASFVAANGDELYCYTHPYDIYYGATGAVGTILVDFTGGTGRFANATGSFTGTVTILPTGSASLTGISGTIYY